MTGGTGGIGKETARGLVRRGAHVILVGRDPGRAADAVRELEREDGGGQVDVVAADLTLRAGLLRVADAVNAGHLRLDALVNNFGMNPAERRGVTVNVAYPGHAYTPGNQATPMRAFPRIHLATSPELVGVTGAYFDTRCRRVPWPDFATDPRTRDAVWSLCERLCEDGLRS
ncbi:SDR family NAD(P)-dependent oxidoreductase [Streptomyces sp. NPDC086554]|uniref:SDR family NAD(P)-dependent oxidoreductase n=1 Tax=Streptomyces sp. NPDC086554 TaxID=3154864 RepID=UPI003438443A